MSDKVEPNLETKILESWSSLDYRADKWGPERIVFDALSNHFPEDSGGTSYSIFFFQDGKYVDFRVYDLKKPVEEIYFLDDGNGYGHLHTILHHSDKTDRETQTGKFGEGLKMISAAALRHGVNIEFGSQDWVAQPRTKKLLLNDGNKEVDLLCQKITSGYEQRKGSYTCIRNPSSEIIRQVCSFTERIIDFRDDLSARELKDLHPQHRVFLPEKSFNGELFVKKIKYHLEDPLYLTYQINGKDADALLSPDRDRVIKHYLCTAIKKIVLGLNNRALITPLLGIGLTNFTEKDIHIFNSDKVLHPQLWRESFYERYGPKGILAERGKDYINQDAQNQGFNVVKGISSGFYEILHLAGIKTVSEVFGRNLRYETIKPEALSSSQRAVYELHRTADIALFNAPLDKDLKIFSHAFDENGEASWFRGMCHLDSDPKKKPRIHIRIDQLQNPQTFLETYGHEAIHAYTKAVDLTKEFEEGLTKGLGKLLERYCTKQ